MQDEAKTVLAENSALKTACQAAEKANEESREKSTMAEVSDFDGKISVPHQLFLAFQ